MELLVARKIRGIDGASWTVQEMRAHDVPGALHTNCLIFDGGFIVCRFWFFPLDWLALSDAALLALMDRPRVAVAPA